jgi:BirA family biotin operon repressor/biotin-[acetyl-CoA-carboxylase] ligase
VVETIDSTNAELLRLPSAEVFPGLALLAMSQSGGRGRSDRVWESPEGGMYLSAVLCPGEPSGLALLGALAVLRLLESYGIEGQLRWPNDVTIGGRKIAGVLPVARFCGNLLERAVLGVGLNVAQPLESFPSELQGQVTTLIQEGPTHHRFQVVPVAREYLGFLAVEFAHLQAQGLASFCSRCSPYLEGVGQQPALVAPGVAPVMLPAITGLTASGGLALAEGQTLEVLGREQRLRFAGEF